MRNAIRAAEVEQAGLKKTKFERRGPTRQPGVRRGLQRPRNCGELKHRIKGRGKKGVLRVFFNLGQASSGVRQLTCLEKMNDPAGRVLAG